MRVLAQFDHRFLKESDHGSCPKPISAGLPVKVKPLKTARSKPLSLNCVIYLCVSQPHAPGATAVWTTYDYDVMGRTTSVTAPDGSVTTYAYGERYGGGMRDGTFPRPLAHRQSAKREHKSSECE